MSLKPVVFRQVAERDIDGAFDYYLAEAGEKVALGFSAALERTLQQIAHHPGAGSPRPAHELDLPRLRSWSLRRFPFLVFYAEGDDHIEIWRVLHAERDIPAHLRESQGD